MPREDIIYLADRKNAPYGTKTKEELIALTKKDIQRLREMGVRQILIACCTASTVYHYLDQIEREISLPIITPAAELAAKYGRVYVIATRRTAESGAFGRAIRHFGEKNGKSNENQGKSNENQGNFSLNQGNLCENIGKGSFPTVIESAEQELVRLVESGSRDGRLSLACECEIDRIVADIKRANAEALVLGCTHFTHLEGEFKKRLSGTKIISPAKLGAMALYEKIKDKRAENGRNIYM